MVDLTDEADADWMARGRPEASDEEHAQLCGDVIARAGRRFFLVRPGIAHGHDAADPLPLDTEASIFDVETRTLHDTQPLGTVLEDTPTSN